MNAIYKVIWNDALRLYQVVNEMCRSRRKACSVKAVHMEGSGRTLKRSVLATAAAVTMMAGGGAFAMDLPGMVIDLGGGRVTTELPTYEVADLPSAGESIEIDLRESSFTGLDQNIFNQDEADRTIGIFRVNGSWSAPDGLQITFVDKNGDPVPSGLLGIDNNNFATFLYDVNFGGYNSYTHLAQGSFVLKQIDLTEDNGTYGQYLEVGTEVQDSPYPDLKATLTGGGNITFGYGGTAQHGYLTLAGDGTNTYSGRTFVGYTSDGQKSAAPTTIFFGKTEAFGNTLNLNVESDSEVFISGESKTEDYFQRVHGLQGEGLIDLGTRANLELAQSGKTTGNYDDAEGVIRIDNKFTGSGNTTDPASGAWIDIKLSDTVAGDIVRFSNDASEYTGVIALTDATIEGYDATRKLDLNGGTYSPNKILTTSTLRLESGGQLLIDGTSVDSLYNLVLNNNQGWTDGGNNRNALSFKNVQLGEAALNVTGKLTLESDGTVSIDNLTDGGLEGAVSGKSFFDADDGLTNVLIEVAGNVDLGEHTLNLTGAAVQGSGTDVNQMVENEDGDLVSKKVAEAKWEFNKELQYESGADGGNDSLNIEYSLKEIDIVDDMTFTLQADEDSASEGQDFTALISGNGHLAVDASGKKVSIGHEGGNTYTGNTTVTEGTSVLLTKDAAFGGGSGTLSIGAGGSVELAEGVQQSGTGLSGTGALVIGTGAEYALTQNSNAKIENTISGNGTFKVDLRDIGHELTFTTDNAFSGTLDLSNALLNLSKNSDALSSSRIVLNDGTKFNFGKDSTVASLVVKGNADLNADSLVIGGDAVLNVSGQMSFDTGRIFDIYDVEVADNINLVDFDGATSVANKFIQAGDFDANGQQFAINVNVPDATPTTGNKQQVVREYAQGSGNTRDIVAETTWLIDQGLTTGDNALKAGVQLTNINVLNGKTLTISAGTDTTLSAQLSSESNSGSIVFSGGSITVSNEDNDYIVATVVNADTTLTLGASHSLGKTSELSVAGKLDVGNRISQTVYGWDSDATGSITLDGSLMLDQTGAATIGNTFSGSGTFAVDLGASTHSLVFSNGTAFSGFSGNLALSNLTFDVAHTPNYSTLLSGTNVQLNTGAIFDADAAGSIQTGRFEFNGGTLLIGDVTAGNETDPKLSVAGDIVISQDSTIALDGINLQGTQNILAADNGVTQAIAKYTGQVSGSLSNLTISGIADSEIKNDASGPTVAYGVWGSGGAVHDDSGNKTLDVQLTLEEIQLADTETGLILDASALSAGADSTITARITNRDQTAGKIVFAGGKITLGGTLPNTYTGETEVTGATVTFGKDSGFGTTSKLLISSGAQVALGTHNQTVGALEIGTNTNDAPNALTGTGTLTVGTSGGSESHIYGTNDFSGTVALASGHHLYLNNTDGLGDSAKLAFNEGGNSTLTISGAGTGTFATTLSGSGSVELIGSTDIEIAGSNSKFGGNWLLSGSSTASVSGTSANSVDAILGGSGGTVTLAGTGDRLTLTQAGNTVNVAHAFAGNGYLEVLGTGSDQFFSFAKEWDGFSGTMEIDNGLHMTVGGTAGANNAHNLANADFILSGDSTLTVASGGSAVDTFKNLSIQSGTIVFEGTLGFGADTNELAQLVVNSLTAETGSVLNVALPSAGSDMAGSLNQSNLLETSGLNPFQTLIVTNGLSGFENLQLSGGNSGSDLRQNIVDGAGMPVATGHYDYVLASGGSNNNDVGIAYTLKQVDIADNRTLTLTGSADGAELNAVVTGSKAGDLLISGAANSSVLLTGVNTYSGTTTVSTGVTLTAGESGLGHTENLLVSGKYVNSGANTIGGLTVDNSGSLVLNPDTTLTINELVETGSSTIAGTLSGTGTILLANDGVGLTISSSNSSFGGTLILGEANGAGVLTTITNADALGFGKVEFGSSGSTFAVDADAAATIRNNFFGSGTITVDLGSGTNAFVFATDSTKLVSGSDLNLTNASYSLDSEQNAAMAGRLDITVGAGATLSNKGDQNRIIHGLTLDGGLIDFGILDDETGQFNLNGGSLVITGNDTKVAFDTPNTTETGDRIITDGQNLLSGGLFDLTLVSGIGRFDGELTEVNGKQEVVDLETDESFSGSHELLLQDVNDDGSTEKVANLYRDSGHFYYNSGIGTGNGELTVEYSVRVIDLLHGVDNEGLTINVAGRSEPSVLSARVSGAGNIVFEGGDITIGVIGDQQDPNSYTGKTYIRDSGDVTILESSGFGWTKELNIASGSYARLGSDVSQTVGSLANTGTLNLGSGSTFTILHELSAENPAAIIDIATNVQGASDATFAVNGAYGKSGRATLDFTDDNASNLKGSTFSLSNVLLNAASSTNKNFTIAASADDFVLDAGSLFTVNAAGAGTGYNLNELSFLNGGSLRVEGVTLTTGETNAVIQVGKLDLSGSGTLSVSADITDDFNLLEDDGENFSQTLIAYGDLIGLNSGEDPTKHLGVSDDLGLSPITSGGATTAWVSWDGDIRFVSGSGTSGSVVMAYHVDELQLALETDDTQIGGGLEISADNSTTDKTLSATIVDYGTTKGTITFAGGDIRIGGEGKNTYHGKTYVTSGSVTLDKDSGFGNTQLLSVTNGTVDLNDRTQTLGALQTTVAEALKGDGKLTLGSTDYSDTTSRILGNNVDLIADIELVSGHAVEMNSAQGLGASGQFILASGTSITISSDNNGTLSKTVSGSGGITLVNSLVTVNADNSGFMGQWTVSGGSTLHAATAETVSADAMLGTGVIALSGAEDTADISFGNAGTDVSLDNVVSGSGHLIIEGGNAFNFATAWNPNTFTGSMTRTSGSFALSATAGSSGAVNAANMQHAGFEVGSDAVLVVESGGSVSTFDDLTVNGGSIRFGSTLSVRPDSTFGNLTIGGALTVADGDVADISIDWASGTAGEDRTSDTLENTSVVSAATNNSFVTLINGASGTVDLNDWTLNTETNAQLADKEVVQGIGQDISGEVADAVYGYQLSSGDGTDLGILFDMKGIRIYDNAELNLTETGTLDVNISDKNAGGNGGLLVRNDGLNGGLILTGENTYTGATTVASGSLTARESGLGATSALIVEEGATYTNAGLNTVGSLDVNGKLVLNSATTLEITSGTNAITDRATVSGDGVLNLNGGSLTVTAEATSTRDYSGAVRLAAGTDLNLTGTEEAVGLGMGVINTAAGADVLVSGAGNRTLTNTIAGAGTLTVDLGASGNLFRFNADQSDSGGFTGTLNLTSGTVDLTADDVLQSATLATNPNAVVIVNASESTKDRSVGSLHLEGGRLDFGTIDTTNADSGQIVVSGNVTLDANTQTTVDFALSNLADVNGAAAFGTGQKIYIIEGYDDILVGSAADHFVFSGNDQTDFRQTVQQHGDDVAELAYNSGAFGSDASGIFAEWDLSQINLLSKDSGGYVISSSGSDAITATITGSGDVTYKAGAITIASTETNDYSGSTFVTGAALNLAKDEALGNTSLLSITSGSVAVNATHQTIGSLQTTVEGAITMATGGRLELAGDSSVSGANNGIVSGSSIALATGSETLTVNHVESLGQADISLGDGTTLLLSGIASGSDAAVFDNAVSGASGTVALDSGAQVEFTSMDNGFGTLHVYGTGTTAIVNNMQADDTALGDALVDVDSGSRVELAGTSSWTLNNALDIASGGTLAVTAGGSSNVFSFGNTTNQNVIGNVSLTNALLYIGGDVNGGSGNAAVLKTATLEAGSGAAIHVATGDSAQQLAGLDISGGDVYFEGTLGLNADTTDLGQLTVKQLTLGSGTIHATASDTSAGAGSIKSSDVIAAQADGGSYQNLIRVSGDQTLDDDALNGLDLSVVDNAGEEVEGIVSKIMSGDDEVAEGTYDYVLAVGEGGKSLGVAYTLTEINLLQTLDVVESGTMTARLAGTGNLTVSKELKLAERTETNGYNTYTGETTVALSGKLTAEANTLGHGDAYTSKLTVNSSGAFTNDGDNVIGSLEANGDLELNATLTIKGGDSNSISDDVKGSGDVVLESGKLTAQNSVKASGYEGDIVLGVTNGSGAELELNGLSGFGSGQIQLANAESDLRLTNLSAGTTTFTNTVSGAGDIYANSTAEEAVFGFNSSQTAAMLSGASVQLSGVDYDLSAEGSDVLDYASLSLTDGTLYVNRTGVQSNRTIAGLRLDGAKVDFGEMGTEGGGVIDLEKNSLNVSESGAVFTFESDLSAVQSDNGAAALTTGETITLVTNAAGSNVDNITVNAAGGSGYSQAIEQGDSGITAYLTGAIASGLTASDADNDGYYDLSATLTHQNLEIVSNFVVSSGGELSLKVTDHDYDSQTGSGAGSLTISGAELTLSNSDNDYHGATNIEAGGALTLANNRVLGNTSLLNVDGNSTVSFGETNQTIGKLQSSGVLTSAAGENAGTLTITNGGRASGDNRNFHMDVELSGTKVLTLTSAGALGDGDVTIVDADSQLVLEAIGSGTETATVYGNSVQGAGGISITSGANVELTGENGFGSLTVGEDSTVSAVGDVYSHIGKGTLNLVGTADFTVTDTLTGNWTWNKTVSGTGMLVLGRTESPNVERELLLDAGAIKEFGGTLSLENWNITLLDAGNQTNGTLAALSGSALKTLVIGTGASADITGEVDLSNKTVSVASGMLSFAGVDAPGGSNDDAAHLTVGRLELGSDFVIDLGVTDPDVEAGSLLTQDTASGTTVTVATGLNGIGGTPEDGHVTVNGSEVADNDTIRFNIEQTSTEEAKNGKVAEGIYDVDIKKTSGAGNAQSLVVEYKLEGVDIDDDKTLEMRGTSSDQNDDANTFGAYLTGAGNLEIAAESVRLTATNSYTGTTTVASGATLYVDENSLGTDAASTASLNIAESGAVHVNGNNVVRGIQNNGGLYLGSQYPTGDAGEADAPTLTLQSDVSAGSRIDGTLYGVGTLKVVGSGDVDNENPADLTIVGSQGDFLGDLVLDSGAWVHLDATSSNLFGSSSSEASNEIQVSKDSLLTIASDVNRDSAFSGVLKDGSDGKGGLKGGRVVMTLASTDNEFAFSSKQSEDDFTGTFALERGTINLGNLTDGGELGNRVLAKATLELGAESVAELERSTAFSAVDSFLGGLTMNGGTIAFGSINYDGGDDPNVAGAHASHINLGGDGVLTLVEQGEGQKQSTITISQDETNRISDAGDELLAADDGTSIVLIHNIGSLHYIDAEGNDFGDVTDKALSGGYILSEHLHLDNDATEHQLLEQHVTENGVTSYREVAEVVRTFNENLTFGESNISGEDGKYAVSLGYTVDRVGLLFMTESVSTPDFDYMDNDMWQGLTITTSTNKDLNNYEALITNGGSGTIAGNLVLRGNAGNELTISNENTYTGKTWLKDGAKIVFGADSAFGTTEALRIDSGSTVDFGTYDQTVGGLFALGDGALQSDVDSLITVTEDAVIRGSNTNLIGNITFEGNAEINNADGLGTGTVTLAGNGSQLEISGASGAAGGEFVNTLVGGENTSVQMSGSDIALGTDQLENYEGSFNLIESELDLSIKPAESDETVLGNVITTDVDSTLSASLGDGTKNFIFAEGSKIAGALAISNGAFNLSDERNLSALDKTDLVIGGAGRLEIASDIGAENVDNLTLNTGSIIAFSGGGTPGSAGYDDSKGHLDLGDGTLTVNGNVGVEVDVGMVNADLVEDAMHDVSNLPLTAQDVLTADQGGQILANLVEAGNVVNDEGAFTLTVTGGVYDSTNSRLEVGIFNDGSSVKVAKGIYDYTVRLTEDGLNLSYGLTGVELIKDQTLSLKGYAETDDIDNTLSIAVTGDGSLSIDAGTITLTGQNGYKGSTTVAGGATLVTGIGGKALGETSSLNLKDTADGLVGARVEIHGDETVGALNIDAKSTLALGAAAENDRTEFTIKNTAGVESTVNGQITGGRDSLITVIGNADSNDHDLVVTSANNNFYGDVTLQDAYVRLESINSFGSEGILRLDTTSTLEINSNADDAQTVTDDDGTIYTYHKFENLISGDGTVRVALDDADDYFDFAEDQYKYPSGDDQAFTGTLELAVGKFRFTDRKADVLESVHVKLDGDATLDVSADTSETTDRTMRGLTLAGGTLEFGSLALDREQAEARATHIDLNGYDLTLEDSDRQVEVSFRQDATNYISDAGSEVVNAADGDGSKIVLIHDIGKLVVDGQAIATAEDAQAVLQDYLKHEFADNAEDQILHQSIAGAGQEADVQQVARVNREFGDFGYADMSAQNLGNALYVGYEINSIELLYRGSNNEAYGADGVWKGLTVSTSDLSNQLKAQLTGQGNLVVTGGTGGTLLIGDASTETEYNNYTGRTWVTGNAKVEFAEDNAFGNTSHLRVDVGSSVNLGGDASGGGFSQTVGSLVTYDENALIGGKDASVTVTGSAQIAGNNSGFYGNLIFDTEQVTTGTVTDVEGLGKGDVYIGENYQLQITDVADASGGSVLLENDLLDVNGEGGLLQIGSGLSKPEHESTTIIAGNNSNFSGNIRVEDGWAISAEVGEGEDIADRLGTGSLTLAGDASATIDFGSSDVEWNHNVDGRGTLNVATDADKTVSIGSGLGSGFEGTFTVGGGRFELADNADKLGNGNLAASGGNASIIVSDDGPVEFGNNLTITGSNEDRGQLVFEDSIKLSDNGSPELIVDGNLTLKGADVSVSVDGELEAGQGPNEPLDMSSITMADEGSIDYVIAKAGLIDMSDTTLSLETDGSGNAMTVDITDGGKKVATGKYDFGLSVSTDRTELGLSYRLVEVEIDDADTLLGLQGAVSGSTSAADWANASEFSAKITGAGGISLVNGNLTLTGAENTYHGATVVYDGAVLTVESSLGNTSLVTVAEGGRLVNASDSTKAGAVNVAGRLDLEAGSKLSLKEGGESSITGSITGSGNLELLSNASVAVTAGSGYEAFTGSVTMEEGAEYALSALNGSTVIVRNDFADSENSAGGTVRFDKASGSSSANYSLAGSADGFTGTFELGGNVVVSANSIDAIGGEGSELLITTGKVGDESEKATLSFEYDDELVGQNDSLRITQGMTEGITFEKSGDGVVDLSDNAMGAGAVDVKEGGVLFGTSDRKSAYDTALEIAEDAWAAGFGGVSSLKVDLGGSFYVGGRSGYNSVFASTTTKAANEDPANTPPAADNTVDFVVNGSVTNAGTIYVGNKNADGSAPADGSSIGNELVIKGDYNVTASDKDGVGTGGIFDMNAIIAGDDSIADHVTITGKINGNGYVDVNYDSTVSTGGTLEYLGLVKVEGGDDGDSLRLKDTIKIGDLWYRLMWSSDQNEYYLQSSVTDPGDKPWDTEDVENVNAGTRSALAFMQAQAFDLSLRGHLGETLYVDPVTGEQRKSSFWMVQRGDWTKFSNASGQLDADGNLYTTHLGTDLFKRETDGATFRWGVLAGFADGDFDVSSNVDGKSSKGSFRGYSAGLYMTAESKAESGPFLGLQLRWNRFDSEVGQDDYDVNGLSLTAEASWDQLLSKGITDGGRNYEWRLEPHVRAYWTNFGDPDDWTSSLGETYSSDFDNGLLVRVGARTKIQTTLGTGPAWQAYAEANWVYNNGDYSTTMSTKYGDVTSTQNGAEFAEFRLGLEAQFTTNVNVWLEGHHQTGSDDYESTGAMFGFKYMW